MARRLLNNLHTGPYEFEEKEDQQTRISGKSCIKCATEIHSSKVKYEREDCRAN